MKVAFKAALPLGLALVAGSALAVDFGTTAFIDGTSYTVGAAGSPVQRLGDSLSFSIPSAVAITAPKTVTLEYSVSAGAGKFLSSTTQFGTGATTGASTATFDATFTSPSSVENASQTNSGPAAFSPWTYVFANPVPAYTNVRTTLSLIPVNGVATATAYTANYKEVVPEPMTLGALALGLVGLVRRKRK